jgi:hypothetical protein
MDTSNLDSRFRALTYLLILFLQQAFPGQQPAGCGLLVWLQVLPDACAEQSRLTNPVFMCIPPDAAPQKHASELLVWIAVRRSVHMFGVPLGRDIRRISDQ